MTLLILPQMGAHPDCRGRNGGTSSGGTNGTGAGFSDSIGKRNRTTQQSFQPSRCSSRGLTKPEFSFLKQQSLDVCSTNQPNHFYFFKLGDRIEAVSAKIFTPGFLNALDERLLRFRELESDAQIVLDARYQKLRGLIIEFDLDGSQRLLQTGKYRGK